MINREWVPNFFSFLCHASISLRDKWPGNHSSDQLCRPGLRGRIQSKHRFEETTFATTPCEGRGQDLKLTSLTVEKIKFNLPIFYGSRPTPGIVVRFALSGSCPAGQDDNRHVYVVSPFHWQGCPATCRAIALATAEGQDDKRERI
jgi:hypothetical protein